MEHDRHGRGKEQGKGKHQREARHVLELLDAEHMVERGQHEGACHQSRHEGIHHDLNAPVDIFIGRDEQFFNGPKFSVHHGYLTSSSRPM